MLGTLYKPARLAIIGLAVWVILFLAVPATVAKSLEFTSIIFIFICYCGFFTGTFIARSQRSQVAMTELRGISWSATWMIGMGGVIGVSLRLYDRIFVRGAFLADSVLGSREALLSNEAGLLSILSALLYPLCYLPLLFTLVRRKRDKASRAQLILAWGIFALPSLEALIFYSRSQMLVALTMGFFMISLVYFDGRLFARKLMLPLLSFLALLVVVSSLVFTARLGEMGVAVLDSILWSGYAYTLTPNPWAMQAMRDEGVFGYLLVQTMPMVQYYLHGIFEFGILWSRGDTQSFSYGAQHFAPFLKAINIIGFSIDVPSPQQLYVRPGIFTSFFGPLWTDFHWLAPSFMFLLGFWVQSLSRKVRRGAANFIPLYLYLCIVVFFMPVVNFIVSAQGVYLIFTFLTIAFLFKKKRVS